MEPIDKAILTKMKYDICIYLRALNDMLREYSYDGGLHTKIQWLYDDLYHAVGTLEFQFDA